MILKEIGNIYKYIKGRFKSAFYFSIVNPFKTMNKLKGVFIPLKRRFEIGLYRNHYHPFIWCPKPHPIQIITRDVMWKDKYDSPRYEAPPFIWIYLFGFEAYWYWNLYYTQYDDMDYWEQALWYLYYTDTISQGLINKPDIKVAKESWPWQDYDTKESTWNDEFLVK